MATNASNPNRVANAEIVTIGDELLSGETADTNSSYLDGLLEQWGWIVSRHTTVPDAAAEIAAAIREAAGRAKLVLCSGGLGPTEDDVTLEALALALGCPLVLHQPTLDRIRARFEARGWRMSPNNERQARVPSIGEVLLNEAGTAPAFCAPLEGADVYLLPGVPREVHWLSEHVLQSRLDRGRPIVHRRTLKLIGFGESRLEEAIRPVRNAHHPGVVFGYRAQESETHIKLSVRAEPGSASTNPISLLDRVEGDLRNVLGDAIFGKDAEDIAAVVGRLLHHAGQTVATAESCTGGLVGTMLTEVAGSSVYYLGSYVTYSNRAKRELLGVPLSTLDEHGAVSEPVVRLMAEAVRTKIGSDWGIGVSGIAGPEGGSPEKPVGTIHIGVAGPAGTVSQQLNLPGNRHTIRMSTARIALDLLRRQFTNR